MLGRILMNGFRNKKQNFSSWALALEKYLRCFFFFMSRPSDDFNGGNIRKLLSGRKYQEVDIGKY
jgi:hypothetical protein